jgi:hypothetical protein
VSARLHAAGASGAGGRRPGGRRGARGAQAAPTPTGPLYRIGRRPDPLALPPPEFGGRERFDDPLGEFAVLYAAEQRVACFVETLAVYRPPLEHVAAMRRFWRGRTPPRLGVVPADWHRLRLIGTPRLGLGQRWLDLRAGATYQALRVELAETIRTLGLRDLDVSGVRGPSRALTQAIARWAFERGYRGVAYRSRFDDAFDCWALFEGAAWTPAGPPQRIRRDDPDLRAAAALLGLRLRA